MIAALIFLALAGSDIASTPAEASVNKLMTRNLDNTDAQLLGTHDDASPATAWTIGEVQLRYKAAAGVNLDAVPPHIATVLVAETSENRPSSKVGPVVYDVDNRDEADPNLPEVFPDSNILARVSNPNESGKAEKLTLGRVLYCVKANRMEMNERMGPDVVLANRVLRFVTGDCECGACGSGTTRKDETADGMRTLSIDSRSKLVADKAIFKQLGAYVSAVNKAIRNERAGSGIFGGSKSQAISDVTK